MWRRVAFTLAALLLAPALGAGASIVVGAEPDALVEGHTVYTAIENTQGPPGESEYAAAVAVLVREDRSTRSSFYFPGVLWFDDQYLVQHKRSNSNSNSKRHPCSGAVLAVNMGDPLPNIGGTWTTAGAAYVESYRVTDPNDHVWVVDLWNYTHAMGYSPIWSVALRGTDANAPTPDDGKCNAAPFGDGCGFAAGTQWGCRFGSPSNWMPTSSVKTTGDHGEPYPCRGCPGVSYNALLYLRLANLTIRSADKNHSEGSADWRGDVAGCHSNATANPWPCPARDDDREGNSHPYNPEKLHMRYAGHKDHGRSAASGQEDEHATYQIDIYYGVSHPPPMPLRKLFVDDLEGSTAPYHCHDDQDCNFEAVVGRQVESTTRGY